jgi:predicted nuclease with RNAse H fold
MRVVGLDLSGSPKNETGFCLLVAEEGDKNVQTGIIHTNDDIIAKVLASKPDVVCIDAPLTYDGGRRKCDEILAELGALPVTLRGMESLAIRGRGLAQQLRKQGVDCIEVFAAGSAKTLGVFSKDDLTMQKAIMGLDLKGDLDARILTRDELDAIVAAMTGYLHLMGQTKAVGDGRGMIMLPSV